MLARRGAKALEKPNGRKYMNLIFGYVTECLTTRLILYSFHMCQEHSRNKALCVSDEIIKVNWSSNINFRKSCNVHKSLLDKRE